jgi:hypothetical protein
MNYFSSKGNRRGLAWGCGPASAANGYNGNLCPMALEMP